MKKLPVIMLFLALIGSTYSDELLLFTADAYTYNDVFKNLSEAQFAFKYDDKDNVFYLVTADFLSTGWIVLTKDNLEMLRKTLAKYADWERTAVENKVQIEKEIPDSTIRTKVVWKYGDDWYSANNLLITFVFLSQTDTRHQLVINTNKVKSRSNEFIDYKLDTLYFEKDNVLELIKRISIEEIDRAIQQYSKKKEAENLFQ